VAQISPLGSQLSFNNQQRIENVSDWDAIARKYRAIMWPEEEESHSQNGPGAHKPPNQHASRPSALGTEQA
jgi:hypothetical protein